MKTIAVLILTMMIKMVAHRHLETVVRTVQTFQFLEIGLFSKKLKNTIQTLSTKTFGKTILM